MQVFFGEITQLKQKVARTTGLNPRHVIPLCDEEKEFEKYGVYIPFDASAAYLSEWIDSFNVAFAKLVPGLLSEEFKDSFPIGPWAMTREVGPDQRFAIFKKSRFKIAKDIDFGLPVAKALRSEGLPTTKLIKVRCVFENRYRSLAATFEGSQEGGNLPLNLALFEALAFHPINLPPKPAFPWSKDFSENLEPNPFDSHSLYNEEFQELVVSALFQNDFFKRNGVNSVSAFLTKLKSEHPDLGWRNLSEVFDRAVLLDRHIEQIMKQQSAISLFWYDEKIAFATKLGSRIFHAEGNDFLSLSIKKLNGRGVIHPILDGFLPERRSDLKRQVELEMEKLVRNGLVMAENLGHLRLVSSNMEADFLQSYSAPKLKYDINSLSDESLIIESASVRNMCDIASNILMRQKKNNDGSIIDCVQMPNVSGMQPKFAGTLEPSITGGVDIIPASRSGVPFTHIIKPISKLTFGAQTEGEFFPVSEWLGMRAAKAAGVRTCDFALCFIKKTDMSGVNTSAVDELAMAFNLMPSNAEADSHELDARALSSLWLDDVATMFVAERFDLPGDNEKVIGLDLCQIMGIDIIGQPNHKYLSSYNEMADVIKNEFGKFEGAWEVERYELFRQLLISWLICDSDLHLKNISLLYRAKRDANECDTLQMSPAYDRVSAFGYSKYSKQMAMPLNASTMPTKQDWIDFAFEKLGIDGQESMSIIDDMSAKVFEQMQRDLLIIKSSSSLSNNSYVSLKITSMCDKIFKEMNQYFQLNDLVINSMPVQVESEDFSPSALSESLFAGVELAEETKLSLPNELFGAILYDEPIGSAHDDGSQVRTSQVDGFTFSGGFKI
ncbi:TPA: HipA domain-containing protein [Aeromonas veronii]|nr:HipA domain-containing protein [Aeromonas veronii]